MKSMKLRRMLALLVLSACGASREDGGPSAATESLTSTFRPYRFSDVEAALGGTIPFPPSSLIDGLLALEADSTVTTAIFPHGRSLERAVTDFRAPRTVMLWEDAASVESYRLFVGYTPNAEELEVIAWNWQLRQFDFLFVEDYAAGKVPRTVHAPRELCMACHQDGGPIFPVAPWNESTLNSVVQGQVAAQAEDSLSRYLLSLPAGGPARVRVQTAVMDLEVRESTTMMQDQRICAEACGGDLECRKGILLAALFENIETFTSSNLSTAWRTKMTQAMQGAWPSDRFKIMDDAISDRTIVASSPFRFESSQDPLSWRKPLSPRSPADATGDLLLKGYAQCWSFTRDQAQTLRSWGASRVDAAMETDALTTLVTTWMPSEDAILSALADAVSAPRPMRSPTSVPWVAPADPAFAGQAGRPKESTAALFNDYCGYCHSGPVPRPPILPLSDPTALSRYVGSAGRTVRGLLDPTHPVMPPRGAPQPTAEERQQMLSDLPTN
jgi:hypothetical protein